MMLGTIQGVFGMLTLRTPLKKIVFNQSRLIAKKNKKTMDDFEVISKDFQEKLQRQIHQTIKEKSEDKNNFTAYTEGDLIVKKGWTGKEKNDHNEKTISYVGGNRIETGAFGYVNTGYANDSFLFSLMKASFKVLGWTYTQAKKGTLYTYNWYKNGDKDSVKNDINKNMVFSGDVVGRNKTEQKIINDKIETFSGLGNDKVGGIFDLTLDYNDGFIKVIINNKTDKKSYTIKKDKNIFQGSFEGSKKDLEKLIKKLVTS